MPGTLRTDSAFGAARAAGQGGPVPVYGLYATMYGSTSGSMTTNTWVTRTITAIEYDPYGLISLSSNAFTLQAGSYYIYATQSARANTPINENVISSWQSRIRDTTNSLNAIIGISGIYSFNNGNVAAFKVTQNVDTFGTIQPTAATSYTLDYYWKNQQGTYTVTGGDDSGSGIGQRYVRILVAKL